MHACVSKGRVKIALANKLMVKMLEFEGLSIALSRSVYEPAEDSFLTAKMINKVLEESHESLTILDMGCGSGILGLVAAKNKKVKACTFADVNKHAIELARKNFKANSNAINAECNFIVSNLFENIVGTFDIIIFNTPYLPSIMSSERPFQISKAWNGGKGGIEVAERFIRESEDHLADGGSIVMTTSSFADLETLKKAVGDAGMRIIEEMKEHYFFEDIIAYHIRFEQAH